MSQSLDFRSLIIIIILACNSLICCGYGHQLYSIYVYTVVRDTIDTLMRAKVAVTIALFVFSSFYGYVLFSLVHCVLVKYFTKAAYVVTK